jgi:hypothetical protein
LEGIVNSFKAYWVRSGMELPLSEQARLVQQFFFTLSGIQKGA